MDDPISALDANVKKKIFKNVFMKKFKHKTRLLVTHAVDFLQFVDTIILLKKGRIVLQGNYRDLKDSEYMKEVIGIHKSHLNLAPQDLPPNIMLEEVKDDEELEEFFESISDIESDTSSSSTSENDDKYDSSRSHSIIISDPQQL